jgi:hypothetical protein
MNDVFPMVSTVSMKDADAGSVVKISRAGTAKLALVTDHLANGVRSFVWLTPNFDNRPPVIFAENWQNAPSVLCYGSNIRFELGAAENELDPTGQHSWDMAGAIVSINGDLYIRAAPQDAFYGSHKLINIRNGSVYAERPPNSLWTFLSWQLWIRDPARHRDLMLTEFRATTGKPG